MSGCLVVAIVIVSLFVCIICDVSKYPEVIPMIVGVALLIGLPSVGIYRSSLRLEENKKEKKSKSEEEKDDDEDKFTPFQLSEFGTFTEQKVKKRNTHYQSSPNYSYGEECRRKEERRQKEIERKRQLCENGIKDYVVFDLETTGLSPQWNEIIEIGAVKVENGEITEVFDELVRPDKAVTQKITDITHITNDMLEDKPSINKVLPNFLNFVKGYILVGHNVTFDKDFISAAAQKLLLNFNVKLIDTLSMSRRAFPGMRHYKLSDMCDVFGVRNDNAHRALSDCMATQQVFEGLQWEVEPIIFRARRFELEPRAVKLTPKTEAIAEFVELLEDVSSDDVIKESEVYALRNWLSKNDEFLKEYPLNRVDQVISEALEDNVLEQSELDEMLKIFSEIIKPNYEKRITLKDTAFAVCLDGEFKHASKREVTEELEKYGIEIKNQMSGKVNYLIVGELGSYEWSCENFGRKILKAMELQSKGKNVKIVKEKVFFSALKRYTELNVVEK